MSIFLETAKKTTQGFGDSLLPSLDDLAFMLLVGLYSCLIFLLFIHIADLCLERNRGPDGLIAQQRRIRRAEQRRLRVAEPLPIYVEEDPMEWGRLHPDVGAQSSPPAYYTIVIERPPSNEERMRVGSRTNGDTAVLPPPYVEQEVQTFEANMPDDVVYMV
ncbi:uncharacterized protein LY79DRAFT_670046 [Colletotrichum navitas]|uniref:Uncharacterized protein n=1 Tax=Colletotrichum navitas TaxID=681940 RepID=A0AAD8V302_9PEZI|nr:uncharacterized protein LY79DRAFT_670046 [Colletotrichum navitas]KAK1590355.1 hypothetical protein LY79DRAFT_670046 [Colletotrichum navitas]